MMMMAGMRALAIFRPKCRRMVYNRAAFWQGGFGNAEPLDLIVIELITVYWRF
jgi:hypothetical protein